MNIFKRFFNYLTKDEKGETQKDMSQYSIQWLADNWTINVDEKYPVANSSTIFRCIQIINDNIIEAPLKFADIKTGDDLKYNHPAVQLFNTPDGFNTYEDFISRCAIWYALYGECFWLLIPSEGQMSDDPILRSKWNMFSRIIPLHPKFMTEMLDSNGRVDYWNYNPDNTSPKPSDSGNQKLPVELIVQIKNGNPYNYNRGLPAIDALKNKILINRRALEFQSNFLKNGAAPNLVITMDKEIGGGYQKKDLEKIVENFDKRHAGTRKAGKTGILTPGLNIKSVAMEHDKMQFLDILKYTDEEIIRAFGIPKSIFGITTELNRALSDNEKEYIWTTTLKPITTKIESAINHRVLKVTDPTIEAYYDYSQLVPNQRLGTEDINNLMAMRVTPNMINKRLGLNFDDIPGGDEVLVPFNLVPLSQIMNGDLENTTQGKMLKEVMREEVSKMLGNQEAIDVTPEVKEIEYVKKKSSEKSSRKMIMYRKYLKTQISLEKRFRGRIKKYGHEQGIKILKKFYSLTTSNGKSFGELSNEEKKIYEETNKFFKDENTIQKEIDKRINEVYKDVDIAPIVSMFLNDIDVHFNDDEALRLQTFMKPAYEATMQTAGKMAYEFMNVNREYIIDSDILLNKVNKIKGINQTTYNQIKMELDAGLSGVDNNGKTETVDQIAERLRKVYKKFDKVRSKLIARTETASLISEATSKEYSANGVEKNIWLSAGDDKVRPEHIRNEEQGPIPIGQAFQNGERWPGDESPNCRCALLPHFGEE